MVRTSFDKISAHLKISITTVNRGPSNSAEWFPS